MGSWNGTCMISNLPIAYNEPIVGFIIKYSQSDRKKYSGVCYPDDIANVISLPIRGIYDDYGCIEKLNKKSIAVKHLLNLFNEKDIYTLLKKIERDKKTITCITTKRVFNVGFVMINSLIFDKLIKSEKFSPSIDTITKGLKRARKYISKGDKDILKMGYYLSSSIGIQAFDRNGTDIDNTIRFVLGLNKRHNKKIAKEFAIAIKESEAIQSRMYELRKLWIGPSGKGGQSYCYKTHLILAEAIKVSIFNSFNGPEEAYGQLLGDRD